jgi:NADPH2:quinone reductase
MQETGMSRVVTIHSTGGPEVLSLGEREVGKPAKGQVLIRHHAIGLNYIDIYFRRGLYPAELPFVPGNEGAGEVIAIGKGVKDLSIGDRVAYTTKLGSYAEERLIDAKALIKIPKSISYEVGATMMLKGLTAHYLLRRTYKVKKGDTILVHAAAGGVGLILCQWAKALGATVIGTVGSEDKGKIAKKAGAKHIIYYRTENFAERVKQITKGAGVDVVYDGVGKDTFAGSLDCLKRLGMFVSFGSASGPIEAFNLGLLTAKGSLFATRPTLYDYIADRGDYEAATKELIKMIKSGVVTMPVHARYKLDDVVQAHKDLEGRETIGASVLIP